VRESTSEEEVSLDDPELGPRLLELREVPLSLLNVLAVTLPLGLVAAPLGLLLEVSLAEWLGVVLLASSALLWGWLELRAGQRAVLLAEEGMRLPSGEAVRWGEVLTVERGHLPETRFTIHTIERDHRVGVGFCARADEHWWRLLWLPNRERAREELQRKASRAVRLAEEAVC
jgi:hypothetical protein